MRNQTLPIVLLLGTAACAPGPLDLGAAPADVVTPGPDAPGAPDATTADTADPDAPDAPDADSPDAAAAADATDAGPGSLTAGDPLAPVVVPMWTRAVSWLGSLPNGWALIHSDGELLRFIPEQDLPLHHGTTLGDPRAAAVVGGAALVAGTKGVYVFEDGKLAKSPLSTALGKTTLVHDLCGAPDGTLWLATVKGLYRWRDEALAPVGTDGLPDRDALLAWGAPRDGAQALWVAADTALYALVEDGGLQAWPERDDLAITDLAADDAGNLWAVADGALHLRTPDGAWEVVSLPGAADPVLAVAAPPGGAAWVLTAGELLRVEGGVLRSAGAVTKGATLLGAAPDGSAVLAGTQGLYRVFPGHLVTLDGLSAGATVTVPTTVEIRPTPAEGVTAVSAQVDGVAQTVGASPWTVALDPPSLGDGPHTLAVTVTWDQGEPATTSVPFNVELQPIPTWGADIQPLYAARCDKCHNPAVTKSPLDTYDLWVARVDDILAAVGSGTMPLPPNAPLTPGEVNGIALWRDAGFPQ